MAFAGIPRVVFVGFHPSQEVRVVPRSVSLKGQNLPAAVPHAISNKRAGMSETKLLHKLVIKLLKKSAESVPVRGHSDMSENIQSGFTLTNKTLSVYLYLNIISYFVICTHKQIRMLEASGKSLTV